MTLKNQLVDFFYKKADWIVKGQITAITWRDKYKNVTFLPETVGRKLRELEKESQIAVKKCGKSVQYKYLSKVGGYRERYIPYSQRPKGKEDILFRTN